MITGILTHEVENFDTWLQGFNSDATIRVAAGVRIKGVYQGIDNANTVTIISEADSEEHYDRMFSHPAFVDRMRAAGVTGEPDLKMTAQVV
jgi:hypothetical protein